MLHRKEGYPLETLKGVKCSVNTCCMKNKPIEKHALTEKWMQLHLKKLLAMSSCRMQSTSKHPRWGESVEE